MLIERWFQLYGECVEAQCKYRTVLYLGLSICRLGYLRRFWNQSLGTTRLAFSYTRTPQSTGRGEPQDWRGCGGLQNVGASPLSQASRDAAEERLEPESPGVHSRKQRCWVSSGTSRPWPGLVTIRERTVPALSLFSVSGVFLNPLAIWGAL